MGRLHGGRNEIPRDRVCGSCLDDVLVEFRGIERQLEERAVIGHLGSDVVDREPVPGTPPAFDRIAEAWQIDHRPALGQLDRELCRRHPGPFAPHLHAIESGREEQHVERQVDGKRNAVPGDEGRIETTQAHAQRSGR